MKRVVKAALIVMTTLTAVYISAVVYANLNSSANSDAYPHRYVLYAAFEYRGDTPPTEWYTPEQLGIYDVIEYEEDGTYWLHIAVNREKEPFPLQEKQPVFLYKDKFYVVSSHWVTPGLPESIKQWQIPIGAVLGASWVCTGILFLKWREK